MTAAPQAPQVRAYGPVNWLGLQTLYWKEVRRFIKVGVQTVLAPVVQMLLFMAVFTLAWGDLRGDVLGVAFPRFLAPGLAMMAILTNAFANSSSSLIVSKLQGNSVDFLMPPLSPLELTIAFVGGAVTRGLIVGAAALAAVLPFTSMAPANLAAVFYFAAAAGVMMGAAGVLAGLWAEKFDHLAAVTGFVIAPLTFLSGTFYSISQLPDAIQSVSQANPFFHLIDGFRYGFIGASDGPVAIGAAVVGVIDVILIIAVFTVLKSGWRLKA